MILMVKKTASFLSYKLIKIYICCLFHMILEWNINRPFLHEVHRDKKYIWPTKSWHISSGSVDIEIHFKTLINKHAALISANQCGALLFWLNYACFLSALIWTFWLSWRVTVNWTGGYFCLLNAGLYSYGTKVLVTSWKEKVIKSSRDSPLTDSSHCATVTSLHPSLICGQLEHF